MVDKIQNSNKFNFEIHLILPLKMVDKIQNYEKLKLWNTIAMVIKGGGLDTKFWQI